VAEKSCDESSATFPHRQEILPVDLRDKHPHRQLSLSAILEAGDEPLHIMISIEKVFGIEVSRKSDPVETSWLARG
jgi:hypothetical protein